MSDLYVGPYPIDMTPAEAKSEIMLQMAAADDEQQKWERRWLQLKQMYAPTKPCFRDLDGDWCLRDFLTYAGEVCGFAKGDLK